VKSSCGKSLGTYLKAYLDFKINLVIRIMLQKDGEGIEFLKMRRISSVKVHMPMFIKLKRKKVREYMLQR
jgi:hypothetical protein